jgi:allophanate hydrolase subunit 1
MPDPAPLARVYLPDGIAAGTFGNPSEAEAVLAVRSGNGWTAAGGAPVRLFNSSEAAFVGARAGWAARRDEATYELVVADD